VHGVEVVRIEAPLSWRERLLRLVGGRPERPARPDPETTQQQLSEAGISAEIREIKRPDVGQAIVEEARKGFEMIFMGASRHGNGIGGEILEAVVEAAPCHLVIVKTGPAPPPHRRLLVPYDGGVFSRVAVEFAARYAEQTSASLTIGVLTDRILPGANGAPRNVPGTGNPGDATLNRISPVFHALSFRPEVVEVPNDPFANALAAEVRSGKYDLVVVGSENRAIQHRLFFGRDNERLIREAPVSVAIVVPNVALLR
jgi:nucleotide-binding universal stress UspA family protein